MRYAFGPFVFDEEGSALRRGAEPVPLGRRGVALLKALLARGGDAVSKEQLLAEAWPGLVVEDVNLSVQIAHLRKALGRSPQGDDWIATVPRFGYRLAASDLSRRGPRPLPMLAVLPFQNLSNDGGGRQYIVDGLVDELISALSRFRGFGVFSRHARPPFGPFAADAGSIYMLEGSLRTQGEILRVVVTLADGTGRSLWSESVGGHLDDLLTFQDYIVRRVAATIEPHIQATELARSVRRPPANLDAYDLYLRGLAKLHEFNEAANGEAITLLERAIAMEPSNACYLAVCSWALEMRISLGWQVVMGLHDRRCIELANWAIQMAGDDATALAHCVLGLQLVAREYERGLSVAERAAALNPNDPVALLYVGLAHYLGGSLDVAIDRLHYCIELQPNHAHEAMGVLSNVYCCLGHHEQAIQWARRGLAINPNYEPGHWAVVASLAHLGRLDEARSALAIMLAYHPGLTLTKLLRVRPREHARDEVLLDGLRLAGLAP